MSRQIVARVMDTFGPSLAGTHGIPVDTRTSDGRRVVGEWVHGAGVPRTHADTAIYFVHGSGYALCSPRTHRRLTAWLSRLTGLPVFSIDYRLAPRYRFPTAADDVRSGWDWLVGDLGLAPEKLVLARSRERIHAGGAEMLSADAVALADAVRVAGGSCELHVWPDQVHVFQALPRLTPEAAPAMSRIAAFIAESLRANTINEAAG